MMTDGIETIGSVTKSIIVHFSRMVSLKNDMKTGTSPSARKSTRKKKKDVVFFLEIRTRTKIRIAMVLQN